MLYRWPKAFSIVIALWLSLIFALIWLFLMEYIVPFSRSTVNIENASIAQYQAFAGIEQSLRSISQEDLWYSTSGILQNEDFRLVDFQVIWNGSLIPREWTWNWLDSNWNRLSQTEPIQLLVWNDRINNILNIRLRVPRFWWSNQSIIWGSEPLVLWQISSQSSTLTASPNGMILYNNISSNSNISTLNIWGREGNLIENLTIPVPFSNFYNSNCISSECVIRISLINRLTQSWGNELPYLEYQIDTNNRNIPFQVTDISVTWLSYWFSRKYNVRVPQATTSAAFDFTVFQ